MLIKAPGTRKKKQREVPTLRLVCFHSLPQGFLCFFFFFLHSCLNVEQRASHEWSGEGEKEKRKKNLTGGWGGGSGENIDSCNSPGAESFCLVFIETAGGWGAPPRGSGGSQVESSERGGEFPPRSLTVLTAAHWLDVASPLKRDTRLAVRTGV